MVPSPAPELDYLELGEEEFLIYVRSFLIAWYCVEVAEASRALLYMSCKSVSLLLVAASAIRSRWPSRAWSARSLASKEDGPDAAWNASASREVWVLGKHWQDTKGSASFQCSQEWGAPFQCSPESDLDFHVESNELHMMVCLGRPQHPREL